MTTEAIRGKVQNYLDAIDDKKIKAIYTILKSEIEETLAEYSLTENQLSEVKERRKDYLSGKYEMMSWEEVKRQLGRKK